jgi:hypothetical protein
MNARPEVIEAYFQSVLDSPLKMDGGFLRADCPHHMDNESLVINPQNGDYRCRRCDRSGSMQQFEMQRLNEDDTPFGWTEADGRIITIANKALAKSHA